MKTTNKKIKEKEERLMSFKQDIERLRDISDAEEYTKQLAHLFLGNGLSLKTILLMAIDFGQQHPQWIPVEEELPKRMNEKSRFSDTVLVYNKEGYKDVAYYDYEEKIWRWMPMVTHWMEIVPPRKEENNE